jgi:hypothetical protein
MCQIQENMHICLKNGKKYDLEKLPINILGL